MSSVCSVQATPIETVTSSACATPGNAEGRGADVAAQPFGSEAGDVAGRARHDDDEFLAA